MVPLLSFFNSSYTILIFKTTKFSLTVFLSRFQCWGILNFLFFLFFLFLFLIVSATVFLTFFPSFCGHLHLLNVLGNLVFF